jgi:hypothetical protein
MLYGEIIAGCSEIDTKHINTLCGQNVELLNVKLAVHIVTAGLKVVSMSSQHATHHANGQTLLLSSTTLCSLPPSIPHSPTHLFGEIVSVRSMKVYGGGRGIAPLILIHLGTRW